MSETRRKRHRESGSGVKGAKFLNWLRKRTKLVDDESLPSSFSTRGREIEDGASLQSSEKEKERSWRAQQRALENDIQATADQINSVQKSIDALQPQIEEAGEKAQELLGGDDPFENERFKYWRAREAALHEEKAALQKKEHDLHKKEHDLREEKMALIQKETVSETALHQKEHDLHEEKMALAPKEGLSKGKISVCLCYILLCWVHSSRVKIPLLTSLVILFSFFFSFPKTASSRGKVDVGELVVMYNGLPHVEGAEGVIDLADSAPLGVNKIFIRKSYVSLYDECMKVWKPDERGEVRPIVLLGTPGIGKSCLFYYLLMREKEKGNRVYFMNIGGMVLFDPHNGVCKLSDVSMWNLFLHEDDQDALYVADAVSPANESFKRKYRVILITSPKRDVWYSFYKHALAIHLYLPLWSHAEIVTYCEKMGYGYSKGEIAERMEWIGGTVRYLDTDTTELKANIPFHFSPDSFQTIIEKRIEHKGDSTSHRLVHIDVPFDEKEGERVYRFREYRLVFASDEIRKSVLENIAKIGLSKLGALFSVCSSEYTDRTVSGVVFEHIAHRILERGGTFNCTSLEESESDERSTMCITLGRTEGGARQFREDGDILKMKGEYCVPAVSNFPAFDAAYYPYLFQMTIRKEHPIKGMCGALQKVSAFSKVTSDAFENGVKDCVLVFVVPSNIANKWKKKQPFSKEGDKPFKKLVRQFVLGLDERNCRSTDRRGLD